MLVAARPELFLPILLLDLWLLGYHHVVSTYTRLCFDADSLRRRGWMIYALLPAVCAVVTVIGVSFGIWLLATIYLYWQWFHYTRQSYGIAQAYRRAAATDGGAIVENERLGHLVFYLVPLWGILHRAHQAPDDDDSTLHPATRTRTHYLDSLGSKSCWCLGSLQNSSLFTFQTFCSNAL